MSSIPKCAECGLEFDSKLRDANYCPRCGSLAPHWLAACTGLLTLINRGQKLDEATNLFRKHAYLDSARTATVLLESELRLIGESDKFGSELVKQVLSFDFDRSKNKVTREPIRKINQLSNRTERNEQEGFEQLINGVFKCLRNVVAHEQAPISPINSFTIVALVSLIMDILDHGSIREERTCVWRRVKTDGEA